MRRTSRPSAASRCSPSRRSSARGTSVRDLPRPRARLVVPLAHDVRAWVTSQRLWVGARGLDRRSRAAGARRRGQHDRPAPRQLELRCASGLPAIRFLLRGGLRSHPDPGPRQADRNSVRLTVIGILKDTAPLEMVGISTSERRRRSFPGPHPADDPLLRLPGADPENMAAKLETAFLASGLKPSRSSRWSTTPSPRVSPSTG